MGLLWSTEKVKVRCFCGNSMLLTRRALRKGDVCTKCHQPIPVVAIQHAIDCNRINDERQADLAAAAD